jgi:outer membrane protein OmpA-like peptidoglycan-associated protein
MVHCSDQQVRLPDKVMRVRHLPALGLVLAATAPSAVAQVTVDLHALEALPERHAPATPRPVPRPPAARSVRPQSAATAAPHPTRTVKAETAPPSLPPPRSEQPPASPPAVPQAPPQTASINPIAPPPPAASPPPPPPVSASAGTVATPVSKGLRLTFEPGKSDLTPASAAQIRQLASDIRLGDTTTFNVAAYAPGTADDPSTARRLSLSRAMAVRQALVADGVPSTRIFVRALGAEYGNGPANRVDIDVQGAEQQAAGK